MKTLKLSLALAMVLGFTTAQAAIINVNNATPSPGEYTDLQLAIDDAMPGDTIYLAPTNLTYGNGNIDKQLAIIGPGRIVSGAILGNQAIVDIITFSDNSANGSRIEGLRLDNIYFNDPVNTGTFNGFEFKRLLVQGHLRIYNMDVELSLIEGCIFTNSSYNTFPSGTYSNMTIQNNVMRGLIYSQQGATVRHNVFYGSGTDGWFPTNGISNGTIVNNIFYGKIVSAAQTGSTVNGNISFASSNMAFWGGGLNYEDVDPMFVNYDGSAVFSWLWDLHLDPLSPAIGAGAGGEDIGVYGGEGVYRQDGEPTIPIVRSVNIPGGNTVPANATFDINIISEAHE